MLITTEDKLRFFQYFVTSKPFTKKYNLCEQGSIVFRTVCNADIALINKYTGDKKYAYLLAGIESITCAKDIITFVPLSKFEFDEQYTTPIPQLAEYISKLLNLININYTALDQLYYQDFLPLAQELDASFNSPVAIASDPLINNILELVYNKVIDVNTLDLNKVADRNLLGLLLQYKKTPVAAAVRPKTQSPEELIALYKKLREKKANG